MKLSTEFEVTGLFYEAKGYKLRKYLDIKRARAAKDKPDLMVVMMNPGSSYPLDGIDNNSRPTEAEPDDTQSQIMKIMEATSLEYARILNLSDLRTPDSSTLYKFVKSDESKLVDHSIFSTSRRAELNELFEQDVHVIFGWGVNSALIPMAKQAMRSLGVRSPLGILKPNTIFSYYHPLPRIYQKQLDWVQHVTSQITRTQQSCAGLG